MLCTVIWWAHLCVHEWRQWLPGPQNSSVVNSSTGGKWSLSYVAYPFIYILLKRGTLGPLWLHFYVKKKNTRGSNIQMTKKPHSISSQSEWFTWTVSKLCAIIWAAFLKCWIQNTELSQMLLLQYWTFCYFWVVRLSIADENEITSLKAMCTFFWISWNPH